MRIVTKRETYQYDLQIVPRIGEVVALARAGSFEIVAVEHCLDENEVTIYAKTCKPLYSGWLT